MQRPSVHPTTQLVWLMKFIMRKTLEEVVEKKDPFRTEREQWIFRNTRVDPAVQKADEDAPASFVRHPASC